MPRRAKAKGLYQRGPYWLDWDRKTDGSLRSPYLAIFWYDAERGRIRSAGTRSDDLDTAKQALDRHYLQHTEGEAICPTCGQRRTAATGFMLVRAIADYLASHDHLVSIDAVRARLAHVLRYVAVTGAPDVRCERIDEDWVRRFRAWLAAEPVVSTAGTVRTEPRSAGTIENSVIQLAAAINTAHKRGDTSRPAQFQPIPTKELNRTPQRRLTIEELAAAFRYTQEETHRANERVALHRFLMISVATAARPDAAHAFSLDPAKRQWNPDRRVIALNPAGRRQTKKRRATVIAPWQFARRLDGITKGSFVPVISVRSAWDTMADHLGWPRDGEGGMKIVRRSIAQLLRDAGTPRAWSKQWRAPKRKVPTEQIEAQLGHNEIDSVTDLYAAFDPDYLAQATAAIEGIIDSIEALCPGAFHRSDTGDAGKIVPIGASKKAR